LEDIYGEAPWPYEALVQKAAILELAGDKEPAHAASDPSVVTDKLISLRLLSDNSQMAIPIPQYFFFFHCW